MRAGPQQIIERHSARVANEAGSRDMAERRLEPRAIELQEPLGIVWMFLQAAGFEQPRVSELLEARPIELGPEGIKEGDAAMCRSGNALCHYPLDAPSRAGPK